EVENQVDTWEGYADWRYKPAVRGRHGGMLAASFVLGLILCGKTNSSESQNVDLFVQTKSWPRVAFL
ncbi:hypothetical protein C3L33_14081, partial [Rhododendron williamsianum]